ncbi:MAG TPA: hypothetical protein VK842_03495 [bacterium]|jgi:hypothetical protein|nr:hypothetical protein [bacterium]
MKKSAFICAFFVALAFGAPLRSDDAPAPTHWSSAAQSDSARGLVYLSAYDDEKALAENPNDPQLLRATARALELGGHHALALVHWRRLAELSPRDPEVVAALAGTTTAATLPEPGPKLATPPEPGLGLWISGGGRDQISTVNVYNSKAPQGQQVHYAFVQAGTWALSGRSSHWSLDLRQAVIAADVLGGDCHVNLWLDGVSSGATQVDPATWDRMASELSAVVDADRRIGGVHIYPHDGGKALFPLYAALRRKLKVPLSVATPGADPDLFRYVDFAVLRPVPCQGDAATYSDRVRDMASAFLIAATANNGLAMVGVSGLGTPTAGTWYQGARLAVTAAQPIGSNALLGLSVWGLVADDEGRISSLDDDVWRQMALPLGTP